MTTSLSTCPNCDEEFQNIGNHWPYCDGGYPNLSWKQREVVKALLLCGAYVNEGGKYPAITMTSTHRKALEYLKDQLEWLAASVSIRRYAEEQHTIAARHQMASDVSSSETYTDLYELRTRRHPELAEFAAGDIHLLEEMSAVRFKIYYAFRGYLDWWTPSDHPMIRLRITDRVDQYEHPLPYFAVEIDDERVHPRDYGDQIAFGVYDCPRLIEWIGDPIESYEYKWAHDSKSRYDDAKHMSEQSMRS